MPELSQREMIKLCGIRIWKLRIMHVPGATTVVIAGSEDVNPLDTATISRDLIQLANDPDLPSQAIWLWYYPSQPALGQQDGEALDHVIFTRNTNGVIVGVMRKPASADFYRLARD